MLPTMPVTLPACLDGQINGKLPASLLVDTPGLAGGPTVRLVDPAARSWRAMAAAAGQAGITLQATSTVDSYRPYVVQFNVFVDRYWPDPEPGFIGERYWAGHYDLQGRWVRGHDWYQKPRTAVAAVPGTSNHGLGLAVDVANAAGARLDWLLAHAHEFGWSWETQSEAWHIRYCTGDAILAAVLAYEHQNLEEIMQILVDDGTGQVWCCDGQLRRRVKPEWLGANMVGPITNAQAHQAGLLGNLRTNPKGDVGGWRAGGQIFVSGGDMDVWGLDIATLQGGGSGGVTGPVEIAPASIAAIADATADEIANDPERDGMGT